MMELLPGGPCRYLWPEVFSAIRLQENVFTHFEFPVRNKRGSVTKVFDRWFSGLYGQFAESIGYYELTACRFQVGIEGIRNEWIALGPGNDKEED